MPETPAAPVAPPAPVLRESQPIFASANIAASLRFYCGVLGFTNPWDWGKPPTHGGAEFGRVSVMFSLNPALAAQVEGHQHFFTVENIDVLYALHQANKAPIVDALETKPWGMREYTVRDPLGYRLRFAEPAVSAAPHRKKTLPAGYRVVERAITPLEYGTLIHAVEWQPYTNFATNLQGLERTLFSVVVETDATDGPPAACVAVGRLAGDGVKMIYVTDIMVDPKHQRRGLGTVVMDGLMDWVERNAPPKVVVCLFTGRNLNGFYQQWGFKGADQGLWGMSKRMP